MTRTKKIKELKKKIHDDNVKGKKRKQKRLAKVKFIDIGDFFELATSYKIQSEISQPHGIRNIYKKNEKRLNMLGNIANGESQQTINMKVADTDAFESNVKTKSKGFDAVNTNFYRFHL